MDYEDQEMAHCSQIRVAVVRNSGSPSQSLLDNSYGDDFLVPWNPDGGT